MSYKVKPEDVSDDARVMIVNAVNNADRDLESEVAAIANALIDAGLVSPPVWAVIADEDSPEFKYAEGPINPVYLAATRQEAEHLIREDSLDTKKTRVEHWKGQTS